MNILNYSIANDFHSLFVKNWMKQTLEKQGDLIQTVQRKETLNLTLNGKLGGKIKFILGFIYFFSLLFFTIMLFN
jgi:hypothetical protein